MSTNYRAAGVFMVAALLSGCAGLVEAPLDCSTVPNPQTRTLKFKVKADGCVEHVQKDADCDCDADAVVVHRCDTVVWLVTGKEKSVKFDKGNGSPFSWTEKAGAPGAKIEGTVKSGASYKPYGYTVRTEEACPLDPMIIVER